MFKGSGHGLPRRPLSCITVRREVGNDAQRSLMLDYDRGNAAVGTVKPPSDASRATSTPKEDSAYDVKSILETLIWRA